MTLDRLTIVAILYEVLMDRYAREEIHERYKEANA